MRSFYQIKPNILILGASGGVAGATLKILEKYRTKIGNLVLLDKSESVLGSKSFDHYKMDYVFIKKDFSNCFDVLLSKLIKKYGINIVMDISDFETEYLLNISNSFGVSYLNCSMNYEGTSMMSFSEDIKTFSQKYNNCSHVLSLGMNPGIINHLVMMGVIKNGVPNEIVEIEYDSAIPLHDLKYPFITWSKKQFLNEVVRDPSGECIEGGKYVEHDFPAICNLVDTKQYIEPLKKMESYPQGMIVPHDEVISLSRVLEVPGKFVYAIHSNSFSLIKEKYNNKGSVTEEDILFYDNVETHLHGSDLVGVWLFYSDRKVCYYIDLDHESVIGTSATLYLVAVGVVAGLITFMESNLLDKGTMISSDLNNEKFLQIVSEHVVINEYHGK